MNANRYPKETTEIGHNRTGIGIDPDEARKTLAGVEDSGVHLDGGEADLAKLRSSYVAETQGVGSMPDVSLLKGLAQGLSPQKMQLFIDKLGEREAFERTGVRLYEALISKVRATSGPSLPDVQELVDIREEELRHFQLVRRCLEELGADPTAETPCADSVGVASRGLMQVVVDPRTSVPQSLSAILTAELTDNEGWHLLIKMSRGLGFEDLTSQFEAAAAKEKRHLEKVRNWVSDGLMSRIR